MTFVDGSQLTVEVDEVTVDLVHRDAAGDLTLGITLSPVEAHSLSRALAAAAFAAEHPRR
ncbi:hypothetical protein AA983_14310 [Dermacoccus sp. PE3]|nr:hypothetical protein AA983_14310 [Dermacoccus sp. PE3]